MRLDSSAADERHKRHLFEVNKLLIVIILALPGPIAAPTKATATAATAATAGGTCCIQGASGS